MEADNRLRGQSAKCRSITIPDPIRHFTPEYPCDRRAHSSCFGERINTMDVLPKSKTAWTNDKQRPPMTFNESSVNPQRHTVCQAEDQPDLPWRPTRRRRVLSERVLSKSVTYSPEMSNGGNLYLYNIGRIYSTKNLQSINQEKYATALIKESRTGNYTKNQISKYWKYIHSPRQTHTGIGKSSFSTYHKTKKSKNSKNKKKRKETKKADDANEEDGDSKDEKNDNDDFRDDDGNKLEETVNKPSSLIKEIIEQDKRDRKEAGDTSSTTTSSSYKTREGSHSSRSSSSSRSTLSTVSPRQPANNGNNKDEATKNEKSTNNNLPQSQKNGVLETVKHDRGVDYVNREGHNRPRTRYGRIIVKPRRRENSDDDYDTDSSTEAGRKENTDDTDSFINTDTSKSDSGSHTITKGISESNEQSKILLSTTNENGTENTTKNGEKNEETNSQNKETSRSSHSEDISGDGQEPENQKAKKSDFLVNLKQTEPIVPPHLEENNTQPLNPSEPSNIDNVSLQNNGISQKNGSSDDNSSTRTTESGTHNKEFDAKNDDSAKGERPSSKKTVAKSKPKSVKRPDSETSSTKSVSSTTLSRSKSRSSVLSRKSSASFSSSYSQSKAITGRLNRKESIVSKSSSSKTPPRNGKSTAKKVPSKEAEDSPESATNIRYRSVSIDSHIAKRMEEGEPFQINDVDKIEY